MSSSFTLSERLVSATEGVLLLVSGPMLILESKRQVITKAEALKFTANLVLV